MANPADDELALEFGRVLTEQISPDEGPFYDELITAYRSPIPARRDRTLAFGVSPDSVLALALLEVGKVVLQGIWSVLQPMLSGLVHDSADALRAELSEKLKDWIKSKFKKPIPVTIKPDDVQNILTSVREAAARQG